MLRFNLNDLRGAIPAHYQYLSTSKQFNFTPVQGAKGIMYWATHDRTLLGRREIIYRWSDIPGTPITATAVIILPWSFGARDMVCAAQNQPIQIGVHVLIVE
jgi:hypothetical protein